MWPHMHKERSFFGNLESNTRQNYGFTCKSCLGNHGFSFIPINGAEIQLQVQVELVTCIRESIRTIQVTIIDFGLNAKYLNVNRR